MPEGMTLLILLGAGVLAFAMNAVALPLPPTWLVLASIHATLHVPLVPLTFFGTLGATFGRGCFALSTRSVNARLPAGLRANADAFATMVRRRGRWPVGFVALYTCLPLPSNPLFVAVGMGALPLRQAMLGYFVGRWTNNTIMLVVAQPVTQQLRDLFSQSLSWVTLAKAAAALIGYLIFLSLPWQRWLDMETPRAT